ncbi:MAG: hypothetical protein AAAB35_10105 [Phyllobacterium sp.]|uniref:hypothetical protein n=1 Tax=Phyllobacterium sp. TaxID=1871046 RepID=UPI0030F0AD42
MAKFYIVDDVDTNKLWLVNMETRSAECLDRDLIGSLGLAGQEFLSSIGGLLNDGIAASDGRSDASDRAFSFDGRSDASDRAFSFDGRSDASERAFSFDSGSTSSDRSYSANPAGLN